MVNSRIQQWLTKPLSHLPFRYHYLFPAYAKLPSRLAYRLTQKQSVWLRQREDKQAESDIVRSQMQASLPELSEAEIEQQLQLYFQMQEDEILDSYCLAKAPSMVHLNGFEAVLEARKAGKRVILTGGHFGRFWMAGPAMRALGQTVGTITRDGHDDNPHGLDPVEHAYRQQKLKHLQSALGGPFLLEGQNSKALYSALDQHLITLIFDVPYPTPHSGSVIVPFFDGSIKIPAGVYRIAKHMDALVVPFFMRSRGLGQLEANFEPPLTTGSQTAEAFMSLLATRLELHIRQTPGHWWLWAALPMLRAA